MCVFPQPTLPLVVDPREPQYLEEERHYIIPEGVRPVLRQFRIEVRNKNMDQHGLDLKHGGGMSRLLHTRGLELLLKPCLFNEGAHTAIMSLYTDTTTYCIILRDQKHVARKLHYKEQTVSDFKIKN